MPRVSRLGIIHGALALFAGALVAKSAYVQLWQGAQWAARAQTQHFAAKPLPAPRGDIIDASGTPLVQSRQLVRLNVAPRELRDPAKVKRALLRAGVNVQWATRAVDRRRAWVEVPGRFVPNDVAVLTASRGVYTEPVADRVMLAGDAIRRVVGNVGADGRPMDGVELALDSVLQGAEGTSRLLRDARGQKFESPTSPGTAARKGNTVVLTINAQLQEIADRALADATAKMGATGGDIVVLDPKTGAVLAMASRRPDPRSTASTALTEPYEPGSTLKPLIAAALLERRKARVTDVVDTHDGQWKVGERTITDLHKKPRMTLSEVITYSSNIGISQFATRLTPGEQYETLRDDGFGTPTGLPYPVEAAGTLRPPAKWSQTSQMSMAMGYELAVTPVQLAIAYAALANGGELLEPQLVKEVRAGDGTTVYRMERRVVRRVFSSETARLVRHMLEDVVKDGTAVQADLATFALAGKTGTAKRTTNGRYEAGHYTASFAGLFPAGDPQFVILVKLDNPAGKYYSGGMAAAPITRTVLEAAVAARDAALDRGVLASRVRGPNLAAESTVASGQGGRDAKADRTTPAPVLAEREERDSAGDRAGSVPYMVRLGAPVPRPAPVAPPRAVPDVQGLPLRDAVHTLHRAGFHVQLVAGGGGATWPAPGTVMPVGTVVRLSQLR